MHGCYFSKLRFFWGGGGDEAIVRTLEMSFDTCRWFRIALENWLVWSDLGLLRLCGGRGGDGWKCHSYMQVASYPGAVSSGEFTIALENWLAWSELGLLKLWV